VTTWTSTAVRIVPASSTAAASMPNGKWRRRIASVIAESWRNAGSCRQFRRSAAQPAMRTTLGIATNRIAALERETCVIVHSKTVQLVRAGSYWRGCSRRITAAPRNTVAGSINNHSQAAKIGNLYSPDRSLFTLSISCPPRCLMPIKHSMT